MINLIAMIILSVFCMITVWYDSKVLNSEDSDELFNCSDNPSNDNNINNWR